jgi:hypothetical protein
MKFNAFIEESEDDNEKMHKMRCPCSGRFNQGACDKQLRVGMNDSAVFEIASRVQSLHMKSGTEELART